jgi:hypothetical protein
MPIQRREQYGDEAVYELMKVYYTTKEKLR